jgi:hypothetical protein
VGFNGFDRGSISMTISILPVKRDKRIRLSAVNQIKDNLAAIVIAIFLSLPHHL